MKTSKVFRLISILLLLLVITAANGEASTPESKESNAFARTSAADGPLIVDHTAVQQFSQIPDYWLNEAKKLTIHYGHTSHGSQILSGLVFLQRVDGTKYTMNIQDEGNAQASPTEPLAPSERVPVEVAAGGENTLRISREGTWPIGYWWDGGLAGTQQLLGHEGGLFNLSGWSWCGQVSYCDSYLNCDDDQYIYDYLNTMESLEESFPDMTFFYMTGHIVGPHPATTRRNNIIRDYSASHEKILFDFADIESWDLDGNYHPEATDQCEWCETWCENPAHADGLECQHQELLPLNSDEYYNGAGCGNMTSCESMCAHSHGINCVVKGKAFWWMMARIAGWDGITGGDDELDLSPSTKTVSSPIATQGEVLTYTITIRNQGGPISAMVSLTDTLPTGLTYLPETLWASSGNSNDEEAPTLRWSGVLSPTTTVTVWFAATVATSQSGYLNNTAVITGPGIAPITREAAVFINGSGIYLPIIQR